MRRFGGMAGAPALSCKILDLATAVTNMYDNIATRLVYLLDHKMRPTETKEASPEQALGAKEPTVGQQGNKHRTGKEPIELHISVCFQ